MFCVFGVGGGRGLPRSVDASRLLRGLLIPTRYLFHIPKCHFSFLQDTPRDNGRYSCTSMLSARSLFFPALIAVDCVSRAGGHGVPRSSVFGFDAR